MKWNLDFTILKINKHQPISHHSGILVNYSSIKKKLQPILALNVTILIYDVTRLLVIDDKATRAIHDLVYFSVNKFILRGKSLFEHVSRLTTNSGGRR